MIVTVTSNPSVNYSAAVPGFQRGGSYRPDSDEMFPGGRGVNISRILKLLGVDNKAAGFLGGATGAYVKNVLETEGIDTDFVWVAGNTRMNMKVLSGNQETSIHGSGPEISPSDCDQLFNKLTALAKEDYLILTGSTHTAETLALYERIAQFCGEKGIPFAAACDGATLAKLLPYKPFFVKPTYTELGDAFDTVILTKDAVYTYGRKLIAMGVKNVVVSLAGKDGAVLFRSDEIYNSNLPEGEVINTTGAGDAMAGAYLGVYCTGGDVLDAFRACVAAGSATAFSDRLCTYEHYRQVYEHVEITRLNID